MTSSSKTLTIIQKIIHLIFILSGAALIVSALCYSTNYQYFSPSEPGCEEVAKLIGTANNSLLAAGIIVVISFAIVCILGNKYRKKYYVSNLVSGVVAGAASLIATLISMISNISSLNNIKDNYDTLNALNKYYSLSDTDLSLVYANVALAVQIITCVIFALYIAFVIVKFMLSSKTKKENIVDETEKVGA